MSKEERIAYINRVYNLACAKGICTTRAEFARLLGFNPTTLSAAMKTRPEYLTDKMMGKVKLFATSNGLEVMDPTLPQPPAEPEQTGFFIPKETARLYTNMSESIRLLSETIAKMQGVTFARPDLVRNDDKKG